MAQHGNMYSYQELSSNQTIRLLEFLPGNRPKCRLIAAEIDKAPPFIALSYTWGTQDLDAFLTVDDRLVAITQSLATALDALHSYVRDGNRLLWVDSVSINQADTDERARQVPLMGLIYRSAESVAIWLGPAHDQSDFAMDVMKKWQVEFDKRLALHKGDRDMTIADISPSDPAFHGPEGSENDLARRAVRILCRRSWWSRAWIVQEATSLSPSRTHLFCGDRMIDWETLRTALYLLYHTTHHQEPAMDDSLQERSPRQLDIMFTRREAGARRSMTQVLQDIRACSCQDPRDKVYSCLGLAADTTVGRIIPDYNKPVEVVYRDVVQFIMNSAQGHSLDFLGLVVHGCEDFPIPSELNDLPSWMPDLSTTVAIFAFEKYICDSDYLSGRLYSASGDLPAKVRIDGNQLLVQGSRIDIIEEVLPVCDGKLMKSGLSIERSWKPNEADKPYPTGGSVLEAFNHTLVADILSETYDILSKFKRGSAVDWDLLDAARPGMNAADAYRRGTMLIDLKATSFGRRFFRTKRGLIGLGPTACREGDSVYVLLGGQVLYVLREKGNHHHSFVGECYVHGMMDGQALREPDFRQVDICMV